MDQFQDDSSNEEKDIKPLFPNSHSDSLGLSKNWSPTNLHDGNRKSAFLPYKVYNCNTVLTNLQRGNTLAETPIPQSTEINFHMKAGQGELDESDIVVEKDVNGCDENNLTPLHWACYYGQYNTVQLLVKYGAKINVLGPEEESPLILAASGGHHDIVRYLIRQGADVNHVDHLCNTALMYAARGNHPHTCQELLLNGAKFNLTNLDDENAYTIASESNSTLAQTVIQNFIIQQLESPSTPLSSPNVLDNFSLKVERDDYQ